MARPTKALIDIGALKSNYAFSLQKAGGKCMPMVKANGYGHGMDNVCYALENADAFGVASIEEAMEIRSLGIMVPVLLLEGTFSADEILVAEKYDFWLLIENHRQKHDLIKSLHDSGMGYRKIAQYLNEKGIKTAEETLGLILKSFQY